MTDSDGHEQQADQSISFSQKFVNNKIFDWAAQFLSCVISDYATRYENVYIKVRLI